jgi:hypothetical protein
MPLIRTKKVTSEEQRIAKAIDDLKDGMHKNAAAAALAWRVPYNKLLRRYQGMPSADSLGGHNKTLNVEQENALLLYIDRCEELGRPCKHRHIEMGANSLLQASGSSQTVSKSWAS